MVSLKLCQSKAFGFLAKLYAKLQVKLIDLLIFKMNYLTKVILAVLLLTSTQALIELELDPANGQICTVVMSSFDPINVELNFPALGLQAGKQNFGIRLIKTTTNEQQIYVEVSDNYIYRKTFQLQENVIYQLCVSCNSQSSEKAKKPFYIGYSASESFQSKIGAIQIPKELANEQNIKKMYQIANKLSSLSNVISGHQQKERKIEDEIVSRNIHKEKRIILLGFIECLVILLSGIYQIFALRKFMIQKNLF